MFYASKEVFQKIFIEVFLLNYRYQSPNYYSNIIWCELLLDLEQIMDLIKFSEYEERICETGIFLYVRKNPFIESIFPKFCLREIRKFLKGDL